MVDYIEKFNYNNDIIVERVNDMAKVDWITWKTNSNEIINPSKVEGNVNEPLIELSNNMSTIYDVLKAELEIGGLNKNSFQISGIAPAYEKTNQIIIILENLKDTIENLKEAIKTKTQEQKEIEKKQLINAIEEKIKEEQKKIDTTTNLKNRVPNNNELIDAKQLDDIIEIATERIHILTEKLEIVKTL